MPIILTISVEVFRLAVEFLEPPPLNVLPLTYGSHMLHWTFGSIFKMTKFILIISDSVISIISSLITDSELFRKKNDFHF